MDKLMFVTVVFLLGFGIFVYVYEGGMFFMAFSIALSAGYYLKIFMKK